MIDFKENAERSFIVWRLSSLFIKNMNIEYNFPFRIECVEKDKIGSQEGE